MIRIGPYWMVIEGLTSRGHIESASTDVTTNWPVQLSTPVFLGVLAEESCK